ncbi:response regulator transcription factor [Kitasatospora sp. NPDC094028]
MIVFDRRHALIPANSEDTGAGAVVLTGQGTLVALCALFDRVREQAQPLGSESEADERGLSSQEATVVRLLAQGLTDDAIAKRLGVSARTVRRVATELMGRLRARGRFEFSVRAVQNGWLPPRA